VLDKSISKGYIRPIMAQTLGVHVVTTKRIYKGKTYKSHLLRRSYREGDAVKKETVANLTRLGDEVVDIIRRALHGDKLVSPDDLFQIEKDGSPSHGHVEAVLTAIRRLGLAELIASRPSHKRDLVLAMVAVRILEPEPPSKLATTRWWGRTTLPDALGIGDADEDALYEAMDWLLERQPTIEKKLAARHLREQGLALYDLSSSYFEGVTCPLAAFGHNRDGKKGKLQVNWGLLSNQEGIPVSITLYAGNTGDPTTLLPQVSKVREDFGIEHLVMVGDRGMITQKQISALTDMGSVDWITALDSQTIRTLVEAGDLQMGLFDERNLFEVAHPDYAGQRLVACRNPELARRRAHKRDALLQATIEELKKVQAMVQRGRLRGVQGIEEQLHKAMGRSWLGPYMSFDVRDDGFDISVDEQGVVEAVTRPLVSELERVRRWALQGRQRGKAAIAARISKVLRSRKAGKHVQVHVREDGFEWTIDQSAVVAEAMAPLLRKLDKVRSKALRGQLYGADRIGVRVGKVIDKHKVAKHFVLEIRDDAFDFSIDAQKVAAEAALDGVYVVRTSVPEARMDSAKVVRSYKLLTQVERAIRSMKTIDLKVRPIYHHQENRVRAHFFLCMLAYYVQWHMMEAWRPLLFCDEDQAAKATRDPVAPAQRSEGARYKAASKRCIEDGSPVHSFETLLGHLAGIVRNTCRRVGAGPDEPTFYMTTPPNPKQQQALDLLRTIKL